MWIEVREVKNRSMLASLLTEVDPGEAEALVLAVEIGAERVLIDELVPHSFAARMGLGRVGVLGVLLEAKDSWPLSRLSVRSSTTVRFWDHDVMLKTDAVLEAHDSSSTSPNERECFHPEPTRYKVP